MPSRAKSTEREVALSCSSISGCSAWKRTRRPASQLAANDGVVLIVSAPPVDRSSHPAHARPQPIERVAHRRQQHLALVGQDQRPVHAAEQRRAQVLLERADLMADRRLGDEQLVGRLGEAEVAGRGLERAQRIERRQSGRHAALLSMSQTYRLDEQPSFVSKS